ncbi:MAG: MATE family efflux transporter [Akkermansia sp.]|nr:MATE family efflux transporter [Akkermansia sp.]
MQNALKGGWVNRVELRRLLSLMLPLYIGNILHMGMGVTDTVVAGWKGEVDLAAVAMGFSIAGTIVIAGGVVLTILSAMISRLRGAGADSKSGLYLNNGKVLALLLAVVEILLMYAASYVFFYVTDNVELAESAQRYVWFMLIGVPANLLIRVVVANFEGYGQTRPAMFVSLCGVLINIPLNMLFVFGWGVIPSLGGAGCGLATSIVNWCMLACLLAMMLGSRQHRARAKQMLAFRCPCWGVVRQILRLGLPVGVASLCEMSFFNLVTLMIAPLGEVVVSAQQVAINVSGIIFMLPLSLGIAASIRAAYHVGGGRKADFHAMVRTLLVVSYALVLCFIVLTMLFRRDIVGLYTDSEEIISLASVLLIYCAVYQIPDATQVLMSGLLRGCHDTAVITWSNITSYWVVGLPLAYLLIRTDAIVPAMGAAGAWVSFIISLFITAVILTWRFMRTRRRVFEQLH